MEFTNEIFFNKNLIQGETVLITYSGKLFKEYSSEITIVYGFGDNWEYTQETKMQEKENGFEALITLKDYNTFNFCFKNNYNIWDNNFGFNYIASVEPASIIEETKKDEIISENIEEAEQIEETPVEVIEESQENTKEQNIDKIVEEQTEQSQEQITNTQKSTEELEKAFSELLDSILQFKPENTTDENVSLENGFGLQAVDEIEEKDINEEDFTSCDEIFQQMYNELTQVSEQSTTNDTTSSEIETTPIKSQPETSVNDNRNLENLLNDLSENQEENNNNAISTEELDGIMENILNSIEENKTTADAEDSELPVVQKENEDFLDICIDKTVHFFGNIWKACKKFGSLIKETAKDLFTENG